jgi:pSer/pThr/pTyr-binding forkhead associated (FHA) protein
MELPPGPNKGRKRQRPATIVQPIDQIFGRSNVDPTVNESDRNARPPAPAGGLTVNESDANARPPASAGDPKPVAPILRPSLRPPMAILCAFDDGEETGEIVRVRVPAFVIGRSEGGLVIPHDGGISGRHAEVGRRLVGERYHWYLRDLGSTNGTFVRVARAALGPDQEFLIGGVRFRFQLAPEHGSRGRGDVKVSAGPGAGRPASRRTSQASDPVLVEIRADGEVRRIVLTGPETWIGSDSSICSVVIPHPAVSAKHAAIKTRKNGRWMIENAGARDGVWLRIDEVDLGRGGHFQCGEQRFLIRIL